MENSGWRVAIAALVVIGLSGCATGMKLVGSDPVYGYFQSAFGARVLGEGASTPQSPGATVASEALFDEFAQEYRSYASKDPEYSYADNSFVFYKLFFDKDVPLQPEEVRFSLLDENGNELVADSLGVSLSGSMQLPNTYVRVNIYRMKWLVRLSMPFSKANYADGEYTFVIRYPDGQESRYSIQPE